jgi:hypothetical protein
VAAAIPRARYSRARCCSRAPSIARAPRLRRTRKLLLSCLCLLAPPRLPSYLPIPSSLSALPLPVLCIHLTPAPVIFTCTIHSIYMYITFMYLLRLQSLRCSEDQYKVWSAFRPPVLARATPGLLARSAAPGCAGRELDEADDDGEVSNEGMPMSKRVRPSPTTGAARMWHDVERHVQLVHKGATPPSASVTSLPSRPPPRHGFSVIRATWP